MPEVGLCPYDETERHEIHIVCLEDYGAFRWNHPTALERVRDAARAFADGRMSLEEVRALPLGAFDLEEDVWEYAQSVDLEDADEDAQLKDYLGTVNYGLLDERIDEQWMDDGVLTGALDGLPLPGFARTSLVSEGGPGSGFDAGVVLILKPHGLPALLEWRRRHEVSENPPRVALQDWALLQVLAEAGERGLPGADAWHAAAARWLEQGWRKPAPSRNAMRRLRRAGWVAGEGRAPVHLRLTEAGRQVLATASVP